MSTYGTMQTRIADEILRDDIPSQIQNAIQSAILLWEGQRFVFNERRFLISTVAGQEYYDWPAMTDTAGAALESGVSLLEIDSITITDSGSTYPLTDRTQEWMDEYSTTATEYTGTPCDYAIYADQLRLSPVPDAAYPLTLSGLARLKTLSATSDTNAWMVEGEPLIRAQAKVIIYRDVLHNERGLAFAQNAVDTALLALERKHLAKAGVGRIAPWGCV